jgi:hypothetical protein
MNKLFKLVNLLFLFIFAGCSSNIINNTQYPAPHNDYSGRIVDEYYGGEDINAFMIRSCKIYGGLTQDSIIESGADFIMQDVYEYKCNYAGKLKEELNIDGKSSKRLSGAVARKKCVRLGFDIGKPSFTKCMEELTQ